MVADIPKNSLATRLLRGVLGVYFIFAVSLTLGQLLLEFRNEKARLETEVSQIMEVFRPIVAQSLWNLDDVQLNSNLHGVLLNEIVLGAQIKNDRKEVIASLGVNPEKNGKTACVPSENNAFDNKKCATLFDDLYVFEKDIVFNSKGHGQQHLGSLTLFSNAGVVLKRSAHMFLVLLVNAVIKTACLWLIAWLLLTKWLAKPVGQLTHAMKDLNLEADMSEFKEETGIDRLEAAREDELGGMIRTFLFMRKSLYMKNSELHDYRRSLEEKVRDRTLELENRNQLLAATQKQLVAQEKLVALGTLSAGIAHEINNPNNVIKGSIENLDVMLEEFRVFVMDLLEEDEDGSIKAAFNARFRRMAEQTGLGLEGSLRINSIVKSMSRNLPLAEEEKSMVDVISGVEQAIKQLEILFAEAVEFRCEWHARPLLKCWPLELNRVFKAVLLNACQAIQEKQTLSGKHEVGIVTVTSELCNQGLTLTFSDTGCGIAQEIMGRVFDPFFTTKSVGQGSGLGLHLSQDIIRRHGGQVEFISELMVGSTLKVVLPCV